MKNRPVSNILERTKLSKLPSLTNRQPFVLENVPFPKPEPNIICSGCGGRVERTGEFQRSVGACRRCLIIYTKIDDAFLMHAKQKAKQWLEKAGGQR